MHTLIPNQFSPKSNNIDQLIPKLINNTNHSPFLSWISSHLYSLFDFLYISNSKSKMWVFVSYECLSLLCECLWVMNVSLYYKFILYICESVCVCVCLIIILCIIFLFFDIVLFVWIVMCVKVYMYSINIL